MAPAGALGNANAARARSKQFLSGRRVAPEAASTRLISPAQALGRARIAASAAGTAHVSATVSLSTPWTALGPGTVTSDLYGPVTGRITSIVVDPNDSTGNTVWLGTTGGGVWKSTNAAAAAATASFVPLTDTLPVFSANAGTAILPSLSIGAMAIQSVANPVVLAGTGDPNDATDSYYGEGILRSADGGQTWTLATESQDGVNGQHTFAGLATAAIAWSTATPTLAVAALSTSGEGEIVGATATGAVPGLYYSTDAGVTWQTAIVKDGTQVVQAPSIEGTSQVGAPATSVVWNAQRGMFFAAVQFHGYYSSADGQNWTRLAQQPGTGLTTANCPTGTGGQGSINCPVLRGTLAIQPVTGDLYALTVDVNENDQGLWQDLCQADANGHCATASPTFGTRLDGGALDVGQGAVGGSQQIVQGSYDLSLLATPAGSGGTVLFAGTIDLYRCTIAAGATSCTFRNTTNAGNGCNATSAVAPAQHALAAVAQTSGQPLVYIGNDGGLWRSTDGVAETGSVCASTDAAHFQNLNPAIGANGSLAEVVGFAQDPSQNGTLLAGLGTLGSAGSTTAVTVPAWMQLSEGEGGLPQIDPISPANWYAEIGAGINLKSCPSGAACTAANFTGSSDIGAIQTGYDAALLSAPVVLDPQAPSSVLAGSCRVWRGQAQNGASWTSANALSPAMDGDTTPCTVTSALIRSIGAGGPVASGSSAGSAANLGSEVLYAGMAGSSDGGGTLPGHIFVTQSANKANSSTAWLDVTGSPVQGSALAFNASGFDLSSVVVDSHDATGATVYATVMGFGSGPRVYRSTDFGSHWTNLHANLPDAPASGLVIDPNDANTVYVALDTGVYATQAVATCSTQNCWSLLGSALPNAPITQLQAAPELPTGDGRVGMLRAGTYGRGIWQIPLLTAHSLLQPELSASPASLAFLSEPVATQSSALSVTLLSYGNAPALVTSVAITGDFVETDTCSGQTVAAGSNCTVSVSFAPTATGGRSGLLTIYANVPGGQVTVPLSGTGLAPAAVVLNPIQMNFGSILVNQTSSSQIVTISNTGGNAATLQTPTISGDFAIGANTCGTSLPSQTGCSIVITFTPTASGTRTGVLTVVDSAGTQTLQLMGIGQSPATDTLTPGSLSFTAQQVGTTSAAQQITLSNAGDVPLTLINAVIAGGDFTATNACGTSLAAHSSCAVNVSFVPTATGTRTGTLQVTDQFRIQTVSLSGAGVAPPGISISPSTVSFVNTGVGLASSGTTLTLSNNGGLPLTVASTVITGDFNVAANTCGTFIAPGSACNLTVVFSPRAAGTRTGTLTVTDNASTGTQTVTLTGTGIDFNLAMDGAPSVTVSDGSIATYPLLLTSVTGLSGGVALACTGAPANSVCTVNPSTAQLGGSVPVSVTIQTGVSTAFRQDSPILFGNRGRIVFVLLFPVWAPLLRRRRGRRGLRGALMAGLLCAALGSLAGCGSTRLIPISGTGGGGAGGGGGLTSPSTPGTYPITVTGTASGVNHAVALTLVIQ